MNEQTLAAVRTAEKCEASLRHCKTLLQKALLGNAPAMEVESIKKTIAEADAASAKATVVACSLLNKK